MGKKKDRNETKKSTTPKSTKRRKVNKKQHNDNDTVATPPTCKVEKKDTLEGNSKDMIVHHISLFLSASKSTSSSVVNDTSAMEVDEDKDNNGKEDQLLNSISYLVNFIENDKKKKYTSNKKRKKRL